MPTRRRRGGGGTSQNKKKTLNVCGLSLPLFLILLFTGLVILMYAYFFYAILTKGASDNDGPQQPQTFREEHIVDALPARAGDGASGKSNGAAAEAGRAMLHTVADLDMFRPMSAEHATIHVDGGEDRIWYVCLVLCRERASLSLIHI